MKVSVVIPCYNTSAFVLHAVDSALTQSVPVHEVIVIDDGSTDDPSAALAAIDDPRLTIVRTPNRGVSHSRNLGAELASGELVAFLDADDAWYSRKLELQLALFALEPTLVAVGAQMHHVGSRGTAVGITGESELNAEAQQLVRAAKLMPFAISSSVIERSAFRDVGGFDETLGQAEDLDLVARLAARGPIRTVGEPLGAYRVHAGSASARHYRSQRQGTRFVRGRVSARDAGGDLTWQQFLDDQPRWSGRERLDDAARSLYRAAGLLAAERHYVGAGWRLGASVLLQPSYAIRRLRQQRVREYLPEVADIERIEHTPAAQAAIAARWATILPALSADPDFLVWKNLDRALRGHGDVDAACPRARVEELTQRALDAAREHSDYEVAVICDHLPWNRLVTFCSEQLFPSIAELHFCLQPFRCGTPWAAPAALTTQSIVDTSGIRRSRPAAEALVTLVTHGLSSSGLPMLRDEERSLVRTQLRSDLDGIRSATAALVPHPLQGPVTKLATAVANNQWKRIPALIAFWGFAALSLRSPSKLLSRFNARRAIAPRGECPTIAATSRGRVVDPRESSTVEEFLAHAARGGDVVVRLA